MATGICKGSQSTASFICSVRRYASWSGCVTDFLNCKPEEKLQSAHLSASPKGFQGTLGLVVLAVREHCATCLAQYFPVIFRVATANFPVVGLLGLSSVRLEQRNPSHHQKGCGFGEQEYYFLWLTKITGLSAESSELLGVSPVLITGSRNHHKPPPPAEPGKRKEGNREPSQHLPVLCGLRYVRSLAASE